MNSLTTTLCVLGMVLGLSLGMAYNSRNARLQQRAADAALLREWSGDAADDSARLAVLQCAARLERGQ